MISRVSASEVSGPVAMTVIAPSSSMARHFFAHDFDQRLGFYRRGHGFGKLFAIDGQRVSGRNSRLTPDLDQQRAGAAHLFFQQPGRGVLAVGLQGVRADQLGKVRRLVRRGRAYRSHLVQLHAQTAAGALPRGFRAGQAGADDANDFGRG